MVLGLKSKERVVGKRGSQRGSRRDLKKAKGGGGTTREQLARQIMQTGEAVRVALALARSSAQQSRRCANRRVPQRSLGKRKATETTGKNTTHPRGDMDTRVSMSGGDKVNRNKRRGHSGGSTSNDGLVCGMTRDQWCEADTRREGLTVASSMAPRGALKSGDADKLGLNFVAVEPIEEWEKEPIKFDKSASHVDVEFLVEFDVRALETSSPRQRCEDAERAEGTKDIIIC